MLTHSEFIRQTSFTWNRHGCLHRRSLRLLSALFDFNIFDAAAPAVMPTGFTESKQQQPERNKCVSAFCLHQQFPAAQTLSSEHTWHVHTHTHTHKLIHSHKDNCAHRMYPVWLTDVNTSDPFQGLYAQYCVLILYLIKVCENVEYSLFSFLWILC